MMDLALIVGALAAKGHTVTEGQLVELDTALCRLLSDEVDSMNPSEIIGFMGRLMAQRLVAGWNCCYGMHQSFGAGKHATKATVTLTVLGNRCADLM